MISERGCILDVNDQALLMFRAKRADLIGHAIMEFIAPEFRDKVAAAVADEATATYEHQLLRVDGTPFMAEASPRMLRQGDRPLRITALRDIAERRRAELTQTAQYKISAAAFRAEDQPTFLRRIHEILGELVPVRNFYVALHDPMTDLLSFPYFVDEFDPPPAARLARNTLTAMVLRASKPLFLGSEMLRSLVHEGKITVEGTMPVEWLGVPLDSRERTIGVLAIQSYSGSVRFTERDLELLQFVSRHIADAIERKQVELDRERLQSQLNQAQKMESVGRLAGGVAHDFNNMLTAIQGNVGLALDGLPPGSPLWENLQQIQICAHRSAELTRQLLTFARKQPTAPRLLDLNAAVEGALKMLRRLIGENIDLQWHPATGLKMVRVDPNQIDQVLANLCVNSRDAISGVGTIALESANVVVDGAYCATHPGVSPGDYVVLTVRDSGCGMDEEVLRHVFEPFYTTKGVGQGTGLGLATVYGIVTQSGGFIDVSSEPRKGATFKVYLPAHLDQAAEPVTVDAASPAERGRETILLVEDEPTILRVGTLMLQRLGYTVLAAATPGEAIRLAEGHAGAIHLLLTDVVMPEMNGRDLAQRILSRHPKVKRVFMSGYSANIITREGVLEAGIHFMQKPFSMDTLAGKVRVALDDR